MYPKCNHKCPHKREADLTTKMGIGDVVMEARCWSVQGMGHNLRNAGSLQELAEARREFSICSRRNQPC